MLFLWTGLAWLLGLALASLAPLQLWQWISLSLGCGGSAIIFRRDPRSRGLFLLLAILFLGCARWASSLPHINPEQVAFYADIGHEAQVTGTIIEDPDVRDTKTLIELDVDRIWISDLGIQKPVEGSILLQTSPLENWRYGQRLKVTGYLELAPEDGDFSYRAYLARQGILAWMPQVNIRSLGMGSVNPLLNILHKTRQQALTEIQRLFPYPEAPLLAGILLGIESRIPEELIQAYGRTGTTHIIAISGFNITILASVIITISARWFGRTRGLISAAAIIILYTLLVGADAPVVRAAFMGTLALLARYLGRRTHGLTSLMVAAVAMTFISAQSIQDVGFQLSFAATLGLIIYAEPFGQAAVKLLSAVFPRLDSQRWGSLLAEMFLFTLAAQITTLPVILGHFHQISLVSLLANAMILPLQPLLMILSGIATILGMIWHPLGQLFAWFAWPFSALTNQLVSRLADIPGTVLYTGDSGWGWLVVYYAILFALTALLQRSRRQRLWDHLHSWVAGRQAVMATGSLITLVVASLLAWHSLTRQPDGLLHITFLNVGSGESVLIRTPTGGTILLNGGSSPVTLATELSHHLPYPNRQIDWLILGGTQYDQLAGLREIVAMTTIEHALMSGHVNGSAYRRVIADLTTAEIPIETTQVGQRLDLGDDSSLEILTHGPYGATFLLQYGFVRILLPTGLSPAEISDLRLNSSCANLTAVLFADGGYQAVNPEHLLKHYAPQLVLVSCQAGDNSSAWVPALEEQLVGIPILRTDLFGSIDLATDGQHLWVTVEHFQDEMPLSGATERASPAQLDR